MGREGVVCAFESLQFVVTKKNSDRCLIISECRYCIKVFESDLSVSEIFFFVPQHAAGGIGRWLIELLDTIRLRQITFFFHFVLLAIKCEMSLYSE